MTREEQAIQAAKDFLPHITNAQLTLFAAGAMWADDHPNKGLVSIEKVCKWLEENKDHPAILCEDPCLSGYLTNKFIEDFRKAVEEQQ